jgi:hypothetical protein
MHITKKGKKNACFLPFLVEKQLHFTHFSPFQTLKTHNRVHKYHNQLIYKHLHYRNFCTSFLHTPESVN